MAVASWAAEMVIKEAIMRDRVFKEHRRMRPEVQESDQKKSKK